MSEPRSLFSGRPSLHAALPRSPGRGELPALGQFDAPGGRGAETLRPLRPLRLGGLAARGGMPTGHLRPNTSRYLRAESERDSFAGSSGIGLDLGSPWQGDTPTPRAPTFGGRPFFDDLVLPPANSDLAQRPPLDRPPTFTLGPPAASRWAASADELEAQPAGWSPFAPPAQLLARRGQVPSRLGTNLQRQSLVPLAMLSTILLSKVPLLYATEMTSRGLVQQNKALTAGGEALIAVSTLMMWLGVGVGIHDTLKVKPALQRDPRLRYLGPRSTIFALSALAVCAPIILAGSTLALNHAAATNDSVRVNWLRIPANLGASGQNFAAGFLYTVMQMRRGWTPLKVSIPLLFAVGTWLQTTDSQFGINCGKGELPQSAQQVAVLVPYVLDLFVWSEMFSRLTFVALQNQLTDTTPPPWASARGP